MIKCDDQGKIELSGNIPMIHAELTALIQCIYKATKEKRGEDCAKEMIENDFRLAFMSEEDLRRENSELQKQTSDMLFNLMEKLFKNN